MTLYIRFYYVFSRPTDKIDQRYFIIKFAATLYIKHAELAVYRANKNFCEGNH